MKHLLAFLLLALPIFSFGQGGGCTLTLKNNTDKEVRVAYVYYNQKEKAWISEGWYSIARYSNKQVPFSDCAGATVYIHGYTKGKKYGTGNDFCVDDKNDFRIIDADKVKCKAKRSFTAYKLGVSDNTYIFNP